MPPIFEKVSGTWKQVQTPYEKVSGVQKKVVGGWEKVAGTWKQNYTSAKFPEGAIIPFLGAGVPTGWTEWTAANGRFIAVAGGIYSVGSTGGSSSLTVSGTTDFKGNHQGSGQFSGPNSTAGSYTVQIGEQFDGGHTHTASLTTPSVLPKFRNYKLIRSGTDVTNLPANGVVFSSTTLSTIANIHAAVDAFLKAEAADGGTGGSMTYATGTLSVVNAPNHRHGGQSVKEGGDTTGPFVNKVNFAGAHGHTVSGTITIAPKQVYLAAWTDAGADFAPESGCVVMYEGTSAPEGWTVRTDLVDRFLRVGTTANMGQKSGANTGTTPALTTTPGGAHNHTGAVVRSANSVTVRHSQNEPDHDHLITLSGSYVPPFYALLFIEKT